MALAMRARVHGQPELHNGVAAKGLALARAHRRPRQSKRDDS
jgi:hypothetical protein